MNYIDSKNAFETLFNHQLNDTEMREMLLSFTLDETTSVESIAAAAEVMRAHSIKLPISDIMKSRVTDVVGTGGDKIGSFNISSTVALLLASCDVKIAKHGSRSVTSKSGSADMFEALGVRLDLSIQKSAKLLEESGFTFMFAQNHHPAMKFIMPIRKSISDKTIFNVLGPLTNPASATKTLLGVFDKSFVVKLAEAMKMNGSSSVTVVSSREHMDEISISDITYAADLREGKIHEYEIDPTLYGIKKVPLEAIKGGEAAFNAQILKNIFTSKAEDAQRDIVLVNAAVALMVDGMARDMQDGLEIARDAILSHKAIDKLQEIVDISSKL